MNRKTTFKFSRRLPLLALPLLVAALEASHFPSSTPLWGYEAAFGSARILQYDVGTDTPGPNCMTDSAANGRGIAFDPIDGVRTLDQVFRHDASSLN